MFSPHVHEDRATNALQEGNTEAAVASGLLAVAAAIEHLARVLEQKQR